MWRGFHAHTFYNKMRIYSVRVIAMVAMLYMGITSQASIIINEIMPCNISTDINEEKEFT